MCCVRSAYYYLVLPLDFKKSYIVFVGENLLLEIYTLGTQVVATNPQTADPTLLRKIMSTTVKWGLIPGKSGKEDEARTTPTCSPQ
jgi:hypothetical protein